MPSKRWQEPEDTAVANGVLTAGLFVSGGLAIVLACLVGSTPLEWPTVLQALFGGASEADQVVIQQIRFPRALTAWVVGMALGLSGAALQGLLRNPLAEPGVLGVSASASLGATFVLYYGLAGSLGFVLPLGAIAGALIATSLIVAVANRTNSVVTILLVGVGLSSFAGATMSLLMNFAPNPFSLAELVNWMLGSVANRSLEDLAFVAPFLLVGAAILLLSRRSLAALTLGEEAAAGVGVDLKRQRVMVVLGAGLLSGAAVAVAGAIGFVGIVAPHIVRPLVRHDPARSLVPAGLLAGLILVLADILIRVLPTSQELKIGVVAAIIGAPAFVWIAIQRRVLYD